MSALLLDTGPVVASLDRSDPHPEWDSHHCISRGLVLNRKVRPPRRGRISKFSLWPKQSFPTPLTGRHNLMKKPEPPFATSPFRLPWRKKPAKPSADFALLPASKSAI